jgi:Carboxypeptidase regulatory-like domain
MKTLTKLLGCFLGLALLSGLSTAQTVTATMVGKISDPSGAAVTGAKIDVTNLATGLVRSVDSDSSGDFVVTLLPAGQYQLTAAKAGFKTTVLSSITLEVAQRARVDVGLKVGTPTENVDVTANSEILQTESSEIGMVVDSRELVDIPLNGRKLLDLNLLDAGTARLSNFRNDPAGPRSQNLGGSGTSANGSSVDGNNYLVDGIQSQGMQTTHMSYQPTLESVQEFKQQSSQYDATAGFGGGTQVNIITKSGTQSYHGQAYEYVRNDVFDAKNYFDTTKQAFRLNQFGGVFGGPIIKNHTFFFFSYEGIRIRQNQTQLFSVPSDVQRTGDFTGAAPIYDPNTTRPDPANPGQFIRDQFPGNIIPADRIDPVAQKVFQQGLIPEPNLPGVSANLLAAPLRTENSNQYSIRIDHHFNNQHTIFGRYTKYTNEKILNSFSQLPNSFDFVNNPASNLTLGYTAVLSSRKVNELRFGWTTWNQVLEPTDGRIGTKVDWHSILGLATPPNSVPEITLGKPAIAISGYGTTGGQLGAPNNRNDNNYQVVDNFSFTVGDHQMSFGGGTRQWRENHAGINLFARGDYIVTGQYTSLASVPGSGNSLADFLLGFPAVTLAGEGFASNPYSRSFWGTYFQDNWNVRKDLTLNLGLRYEYFGPWYNTNDKLSFFSFKRAQFVSASEITADGVPKSSYTVPKDMIEPRIGLAWKPFGSNKTVVRSGFGMFHLPYTQLYELLGLNQTPTAGFVTWVGDPNVPNLTLADAFPPALGSLGTPNGYAVQPHWKTPYNMQWSLLVEREVLPNLSLEVGYVGNRGVSLLQAPDINTPLPGPGPLNSRRRYSDIGSLNTSLAAGDAWYHALQVNVERKWRDGLSFKISYAFSKSLSDVDLGAFAFQGGLGFKGNPFDFGAQKGRSEFDARHRVVVSYIYELPFGHGKRFLSESSSIVNGILGGWQVNGVTIYQTGTPVDTSLAFDNAGTGGSGADDRPDLVGDPNNGPKTPLEWFNTAAFALPTPGRYGNARRNIIDAPGVSNFDFSIFKNFHINEKHQFQFRAEVFNLFNHTQFDPPNTVFGTANFGRITSAGDGRQIQLAVKYSF